jgi:hypothetical protein
VGKHRHGNGLLDYLLDFIELRLQRVFKSINTVYWSRVLCVVLMGFTWKLIFILDECQRKITPLKINRP